MTAINTLVQQSGLDCLVTLYDIDLSIYGGEVLRFTSSAYETQPVHWQGNPYTPMPVESDGWEWNGSGQLPTPTIKIANANGVIGGLVVVYNDLLGATVTRWRTFKRYLDDQAEADPTAHFPVDIYKIERKVSQDSEQVEWELSAAMDHEGRMLPGRQVLRVCTHRYRVWSPDSSSFIYTKATCPYSADESYTLAGTATTSALDVCGKKLSDCRLRFGNETLPYRGFPGVSRTRA